MLNMKRNDPLQKNDSCRKLKKVFLEGHCLTVFNLIYIYGLYFSSTLFLFFISKNLDGSLLF
jgi:hypothetical protein